MTKATKHRKRQSKVVINKEEDSTEGQTENVSSEQRTEEDAPTESMEMKQEQKCRDEHECQMDTDTEVEGDTPTVAVSCENKSEEEANGKRKARSNAETSSSKKSKIVNDGFCVFVGNLDNSRTYEEVKDSLATYFMTQSLLVQDIRLDRSKKHAHVDLASEMDVAKALVLNGTMLLDKPMKIAKAKVKSGEKVKAPPLDKKVKDARCLFLKNVPYSATKKDLLKIFHKAVAIRFPGGTKEPKKGIAFVEFKNTTIAKKVLQKKQGAKIQGRVLVVDSVGETNVTKIKKSINKDSNTKVLLKTLIVMGLAEKTTTETLKSAFEGALSARVTAGKGTGRSKRFGFVDFDSEENCKAVKEAMEDCEIDGSKVTVAYAKPKGERGPQGGRGGLGGHPGGAPAGRGAGTGNHRGKGGNVRGGQGSRRGNTFSGHSKAHKC
uniref:RRM domain-containing protein n=2 Tax=Monopterus albus TaxID=43700 RepID=A0A3Q3QBF1_MONAL|nr:nucleolin-like isoform X1 [Monopterus albus]